MENLEAKTDKKTPRTIKAAFDNLEGVACKAKEVESLSQIVKDDFDLIDRPKGEKEVEMKKIATTPNMVGVIDDMTEKIRKYLECTAQNLNYLHERLK